MKFSPGNIYHIYNQGNNKEQLFFEHDHYDSFITLYKNYVSPHCETLCWCLMPNHFHFMIYTDERCLEIKQQGLLKLDHITNGFRKMLSSYTHQFNIANNRSGSLFRPKTKSKCLVTTYTENARSYIDTCFHYIHHNPVEAGLADEAKNWNWSSASSYIHRTDDRLANKELAEKFLG